MRCGRDREGIERLAAGFIASFLVALVAVKFLLAYVRTNTFIPFGIYRILVALAFAFL